MITAGMKVLFIAPKFFGYEQEIKRELELAGCVVDWFDDRPSSTPLVKALIRFRPELIAKYSDAYFDRIIDGASAVQYDVVFVIKGEALSVERLARLKATQSQARFLYYSWDSLRNFKNGQEKLSHFERVFSFDGADCDVLPYIKHLPLFYTRAYEQIGQQPQKSKYDLLFLGSIHSDRYPVIQKIWQAAQKVKANVQLHDYFFYQSQWVFGLRKLFDAQFRAIPYQNVKWQPLTAAQTLEKVACAQIIVDVHHPAQKGLTMRTIESLGARKKLITTNADVVHYDFYHPENILVIGRLSPVIPASFLEMPYHPISETIYKKYSLASWVREIFS